MKNILHLALMALFSLSATFAHGQEQPETKLSKKESSKQQRIAAAYETLKSCRFKINVSEYSNENNMYQPIEHTNYTVRASSLAARTVAKCDTLKPHCKLLDSSLDPQTNIYTVHFRTGNKTTDEFTIWFNIETGTLKMLKITEYYKIMNITEKSQFGGDYKGVKALK